MFLSRSPSPLPNAAWSSKCQSDDNNNNEFSAARLSPAMNGHAGSHDDHWAAAKAQGAPIIRNPQIKTKNEGFFQRSRRKFSATLPSFHNYAGQGQPDWREAEKLGRGRWYPRGGSALGRLKTLACNLIRRFKIIFVLLGFVLALTLIVSKSGVMHQYRANSSFGGGGSKFVIILAANEGGGVMEWKGARDWAIERDSIKNKASYADRWGYQLEIADMSTKKKYAHEWRESWEKVDTIRNVMTKYPKAEWFWWLDLHTFIMEPSISLQQHIFNHLERTTYRDINHWNPLNITHPPRGDFLDPVTASPSGDNLTTSIDMIIPQDCDGFNLGSFFTRRSDFMDRLLDMWWDPVLYEQKHMEWEHKEQDALEHLYSAQPYLRSHIAFIDLRKINSFPPGACPVDDIEEKRRNGIDYVDPRWHYSEFDRDFLINMAGCEWGRDCWDEMTHYREKSVRLNRSTWQKFKDWVARWYEEHRRRWFGERKQENQDDDNNNNNNNNNNDNNQDGNNQDGNNQNDNNQDGNNQDGNGEPNQE